MPSLKKKIGARVDIAIDNECAKLNCSGIDLIL